MENVATLASLNAGIQGGEIDRDFMDFNNYGNLKNKTRSCDKSKKQNQLRIIYNNSNLKVIEEVIVDIGTRLQIVSLSLNFKTFTLGMVLNFHKNNIPFLIAGDINHNRTEIINAIGHHFNFANNKDIITTTGGNSIDHIMFSYHNELQNFQVLICLKDIQTIYDDCRNHWKNHVNQQIIIKKEIERPIEKIIGDDIPNNELIGLVLSKFIKENKRWNASSFHKTYLNGCCCYSTLLSFIKGESHHRKCKIALINYINSF
ncbi:hypothetical protein ACTFIY_007841 [Dictyostelium cf. discoideum]